MQRLVATAAATFAGVVAAVVTSHPAAAASSGACAPGVGVTVVVDFGSLGGGLEIGCDPNGSGKSGIDIMDTVGFEITWVSGQPGFVCRIDGKPTPTDEACVRTPPADAYWGLFQSDGATGTWTYASAGISGIKGKVGASIGWRFESGTGKSEPASAPNVGVAVVTTTAAPAPGTSKATAKPRVSAKLTSSPSSSATPKGATPTTAAPASTAPTAGKTNTPDPSVAPTSPATVPPASPTPSGQAAASMPTPDASGGSAAGDEDGGNLITRWVAPVVVAALVVGGVLVVRRRRAGP